MSEAQSAESAQSTAKTFEDAYRELGDIVDRLESGELSLDDSVALYERGRQLVVFCQKQLDSAELRINRLMENAEDDSQS